MELAELTHFLRTELPRVLRDHPEVRHEVWGIMLEAFSSRQEFAQVLAELRAFREDTNRRFEELREDMPRRFEAAIAELAFRWTAFSLPSLSPGLRSLEWPIPICSN